MDFTNLFDSYSRQARLQPALLALFPIFVLVAVWFPTLYDVAAGLIGLVVACGITIIFSHLVRARGRAIENGLFSEWGGKPTTVWLRYSDKHLDAYTKDRYRTFLQQNIEGWGAPTRDEEQADISGADEKYDSAVRWLLEHTRDTKRFPLVFKENVSYGFRRNVFAVKGLGIAVAVLCVCANGWLVYERYAAGEWYIAGIASTAVSFGALLLWLIVVTKGWVRDSADAYAKALLAACDA